MNLKEIEESIQLALQRSISKQVIGLANLTEEEQKEVRRLVKRDLKGNPTELLSLVKRFPSCATYAIAYAFAEGSDNGNGQSRATWESLEIHLGTQLSDPQREELHSLYKQACKKLGLYFIPQRNKDSGHLVNPMKFQAGILPTWTVPLAEAIRTELRQGEIDPDPDDARAIRDFTTRLSDRLAKHQATLARMLSSDMGPIIVAAILRAKEYRRYDLLPPHLRKPLEAALEEDLAVRQAAVRRPRITLDEQRHQLEIHLPAIAHKDAPVWEIRGTKPMRYDARFDRCLPVAKHHVNAHGELRLALLRGGKQLLEQVFIPFPCKASPLTLYDACGGKLLHWDAMKGVIELKPGTYHLLLEADDRDYAEPWMEGIERLTHQITPGDDAIELESHGKTVRIAFHRRPWVGVSSATDLLMPDFRKIHHPGESVTALAYLPDSVDGHAPTLRIEHTATHQFVTRKMQPDAESPCHFEAKISDQLKRLNLTAPARLRAVVSYGDTTCSEEFLYWGGFLELTETSLRCAPLPAQAVYRGLEKQQDGSLLFTEEDDGLIRISGRDMPTLELRRPGLSVQIHEKDRGILKVADKASIAVATEDAPRLVIRWGGGGKAEVCLSGMKPVVVTAEQPYVRPVGELFSAGRKQSRVELEIKSGKRVIHRATIAESLRGRDLKVVPTGYTFTLDSRRVQAIQLELTPYANGWDAPTATTLITPNQEDGELQLTVPHPVTVRWKRRTPSDLQWTILAPETPGAIATMVCIKSRPDEDAAFTTLLMADTAPGAEARFWFRQKAYEYPVNPMAVLLATPFELKAPTDPKLTIPCVERLCELALWPYPSVIRKEMGSWMPAALSGAISATLREHHAKPNHWRKLVAIAANQCDHHSRPDSVPFPALALTATPDLLAAPIQAFADIGIGDAQRRTGANLGQMALLAECGSVSDYVRHLCSPGREFKWLSINAASLLQHMPLKKKAFFPALASGAKPSGPSGGLDLAKFILSKTGDTMRNSPLAALAGEADPMGKPPLLSVEHVYAALHAMEERIRRHDIDENGEYAEFRAKLMKSQQYAARARSRLLQAAGMTNGHNLHFSHTEDLRRDGTTQTWISWTSHSTCCDLEHAAFLLAGLARLSANHTAAGSFSKQLENWLNPVVSTEAGRHEFITRIADLAPEWLSLSLLIWELSLRND